MTRDFPTNVLASLATGRALCDFGEMHEAAEYVIGHPVWTHEFADKLLWEQLRELVLAQHPDLDVDASSVNENNFADFVARLKVTHGETRKITKGTEVRHQHPTETLRQLNPDAAIICVEVGEKE